MMDYECPRCRLLMAMLARHLQAARTNADRFEAENGRAGEYLEGAYDMIVLLTGEVILEFERIN